MSASFQNDIINSRIYKREIKLQVFNFSKICEIIYNAHITDIPQL